jgi:hypothetical protein
LAGRPSIDPERDRDSILDHPTRRAIARRCRARPHSVTDLSHVIGMVREALKPTVENMEGWGILEIVGKTGRGAPIYALAPAWVSDLREAIRRNTPDFVEGQPLQWIGRALTRGDIAELDTISSKVAWSLSLRGGDAILISLVDDASAPAKTTPGQGGLVEQIVAGENFAPFLQGVAANLPAEE